MTAIAAKNVESALRSRPDTVRALLFYGPDAGLVSERARQAAVSFVDDPGDPFQLIRLDGDAVADGQGRLAEETASIGLFGTRRAIWLRSTARPIAPAVAACLEQSLEDVLLVIEAGDLKRSAPLVALCEGSPRAYALPCYADDEKGLAALVDQSLREAGLRIDPDARALLLSALGGDRLASRGELAKLALYAHGQERVSLEDVEAAVSDVSSARVDEAVDRAFGGDGQDLDAALQDLWRAGTSPHLVLKAATEHALRLLSGLEALAQGASPERIIKGWRSFHFRREAAAERQLRRWTGAALQGAVQRLCEATLATRRDSGLAQPLSDSALIAISAQARRLGRSPTR